MKQVKQAAKTDPEKDTFNGAGNGTGAGPAGSTDAARTLLLAALREEMLLLGALLKKPPLQASGSEATIKAPPEKPEKGPEKRAADSPADSPVDYVNDPWVWAEEIELRLAAIEKLKGQIDALGDAGGTPDARPVLTSLLTAGRAEKKEGGNDPSDRTVPGEPAGKAAAEITRLLREIEEIHRENLRLAEEARSALAGALLALRLSGRAKAYAKGGLFSSGTLLDRRG
ncbi:MAG: hypothetical protein K6U74_01145 [Firmicutes bacterium]|nr:hypothetical protein [Bacillota bacterium]